MAEIEAFDEFIQNVARETWDVFRKDALLFVVAGAVYLLVIGITLGVLAGPLSVGFIELVRRSRAGEPVAVGTLFSRFDTFFTSFFAASLLMIAMMIGFFLLLVPGLLVLLFSTFTMHAIAYEGRSAIGAIIRSFGLVRAHFLHTFGILLVVSLAQAVGSMVVLGVLLTWPLSLILITLAFERLRGATALDTSGLIAEP